MSDVTRDCLKGLELVKRQVSITSPLAAEQLEYLIEQAKAAPEADPAAWIPVDRDTGERWHPVSHKGSGHVCDYVPLYTHPAHAQPSAVPEGYRLVPIEATREQRNAVWMHPDLAGALYRSMVDAAPQPQQPPKEQGDE
ncbi:hypothetical protein [Pseudomonas paeninsulae]|uniref:hypothetical protein n=1 Tax=Pseudomonas paeninsulae TaxID=3110772 RepID=UPI002D79ED27|nr:hypothetical protein [Pseudomonas sp. IT1137]